MADYMNDNVERELDWGESIQDTGPDYILLEEGEYEFVVDHFEKDRHPGSEKLPPCSKAVVYLHVETPNGTAEIRENLFLHTKGMRKLYAFFLSLGLGKKGEPLTMNWPAVPGARGRAKFGVRTYNGKQYNEVKSYLEPTAPAPGAYQPVQSVYQQPAALAYQANPQGYQQTTYQPQIQGYTPNAQGFQPSQGGAAGQGWAAGKF